MTSSENPAAAVLAAVALASVHAVTPLMRFLAGIPRSAWLSIFGGVSVAYVFVHLMPELAESQGPLSQALRAAGVPELGFAERHVYLVALGGLAVFYGLERLAKTSRSRRRGRSVTGGRGAEEAAEVATSRSVFWIHMASFGLYNVILGYLLVHRPVTTTESLVVFALAMALHLVVTDYGLVEDHRARYVQMGRWILAGAVLAGLCLGFAAELPEAALAVLVAFLAGGVILNVLKEEVPAERESRFWAFALGLVAYAALLLVL